MSGGSVLWAEAPDDDERGEAPEAEAHGGVDETFAARRLRRWIKGMFGGKPSADRPVPESGQGEEAPGEPGGSPGESH
jgi:hypothetical protein